jgi:hypothetical protein
MRRSRRWDEMSTTGKVLVMVLTALQVSLAVSAWADLAGRPAEHVNGSKRRWAAVIAVNFVGPMLYFTRGRRASDDRP